MTTAARASATFLRSPLFSASLHLSRITTKVHRESQKKQMNKTRQKGNGKRAVGFMDEQGRTLFVGPMMMFRCDLHDQETGVQGRVNNGGGGGGSGKDQAAAAVLILATDGLWEFISDQARQRVFVLKSGPHTIKAQVNRLEFPVSSSQPVSYLFFPLPPLDPSCVGSLYRNQAAVSYRNTAFCGKSQGKVQLNIPPGSLPPCVFVVIHKACYN